MRNCERIELNPDQMGHLTERLRDYLISEGTKEETIGGLEIDWVERTNHKSDPPTYQARYTYEDATRNCYLHRGLVTFTCCIQPKLLEDLLFDEEALSYVSRILHFDTRR
jgi:hypothetical protein